MDRHVQVELLPKLVTDVLQNVLPVFGREQIGLAQEHLGRNSPLIEVAQQGEVFSSFSVEPASISTTLKSQRGR